MKENELRLGNYYDRYSQIMQVSPNTIEEVWKAEREWCKPIPLTEEWLLKFGFEHYCLNFLKRGNVDFYVWGSLKDNTKFEIKALDTLIGIKHVHQLQNLYFALTGEELTINQ